jgi:pentatricopeptide repeat protein
MRFTHTETLLRQGADRIEMAMNSLRNIRALQDTEG